MVYTTEKEVEQTELALGLGDMERLGLEANKILETAGKGR